MRNVFIFAAIFGGGFASRYQEQEQEQEQENVAQPSSPEMGRTEIRIMLSDRHWMPLGVMNATATLDIWPKGGSKFSARLEVVCPRPPYNPPSKVAGQDPPRTPAAPGSPSCGEIRDMDPFHVEMVVWTRKEQEYAARRRNWKGHPGNELSAVTGITGIHDHGTSYLRVILSDAELKDPRTKAISFDASVHFAMGLDVRTLDGFQYPYGYIKSALDRLVEGDLRDLKEEVFLDANRATSFSQDLQATLMGMPTLSFGTSEERNEYETAVKDCSKAAASLGALDTRNLTAALDRTREACKEIARQAKEAQGALNIE